MQHRVRVGVVSSYPPDQTGFARDAADLSRALASAGDGWRGVEVVVCAVGRTGLNYPDEVVTSVASDDPADYIRAARVLVEHGVDVVLIRYDDGVYGGARGSYVRVLAEELRRHGVAVMVSLQQVHCDAGASWTRTIAALTAAATLVLVPTPGARDAALARRLATAEQLRVVAAGDPVEHPDLLADSGWPGVADPLRALVAQRRPASTPVTVTPIRTDWLNRDLGDLRSSQPDRDARLAVVAARLLALPAGPLAPTGWSVATAWAGRAVRALGVAVQIAGPTAGSGSRAVWGLGAIATGTGVPDRLRHRAGVLRAMLVAGEPAEPAARGGRVESSALSGAADVVLGLADDARLAESERAALERCAVRLDESRRAAAAGGRGAAWPCFGERLFPGAIRLAHGLVAAGRWLGDDAMLGRGLESVEWLARRAGLGAVDGIFAPPVAGSCWATEAGDHVEALVAAYRETGAARHARMALRAMAWFHGANAANEAVYDEAVGACRAGLGPSVAMSSHSTEATLAHLGALLALASAGLALVPAAELSRQDLATVA